METSDEIRAAAKVLARAGGLRGGKARAEAMTPEERSESARHASEARWAKRAEKEELSQGGSLPKETHPGILKIGDREIRCAVLDNGLRVLSGPGLSRIMGSRKIGVDAYAKEPQANLPQLPPFLTATRLRPFISNELTDILTSRIRYKSKRGPIVWGYEAAVLPKICEAILDAKKAEVLWPRQQYLVDTAEMLIRALAHVGIIALVDEATGYQEERDRDALHKILEACIAKELLPWTKRFPDEFYQQMFRLQGWQYSPLSTKRPRLLAQLTIHTVYDKLPPGVLEELRKKNPIIKDGRRRYKLFRFMTEDIGQPHLEKHVASVTTLMRISPNWKTFEKLLDKAFPTPQKPGEPVQGDMGFSEGSSEDVPGKCGMSVWRFPSGASMV